MTASGSDNSPQSHVRGTGTGPSGEIDNLAPDRKALADMGAIDLIARVRAGTIAPPARPADQFAHVRHHSLGGGAVEYCQANLFGIGIPQPLRDGELFRSHRSSNRFPCVCCSRRGSRRPHW